MLRIFFSAGLFVSGCGVWFQLLRFLMFLLMAVVAVGVDDGCVSATSVA